MSGAVVADRSPLLFTDAFVSHFVHAAANAALIQSLSAGFPGQPITVAVHQSHQADLREFLTSSCHGAPEVSWRLINRHDWLRGRVRGSVVAAHLAAYSQILRLARPASVAVHGSASDTGLAVLPRAAPVVTPNTLHLVVLHDLNELVEAAGNDGRDAPRRWRLLNRPIPENVRFLSTTVAGYERLLERAPTVAKSFLPLDHPHPRWVEVRDLAHEATGPVRFVHLGKVGRAATQRIVSVKRRVEADGGRFDLVFGGRARYEDDVALLRSVGFEVDSAALPLPDVLGRVAASEYALLLQDADFYRVRISGTVLHAIGSLLPMVALRTPFLERTFEQFGPLGVLCDDLDAVADAVLRISRDGRDPDYDQQCHNLQRAAEWFGPVRAGAIFAEQHRAWLHETGG